MVGRISPTPRSQSDQLSSCSAAVALQLRKIQPVTCLGDVIAAASAPARIFCPLDRQNSHP